MSLEQCSMLLRVAHMVVENELLLDLQNTSYSHLYAMMNRAAYHLKT